MKARLLFILLLLSGACFSQQITNVDTLNPEKEYDNILVKKINSNKHTSSFVIWVKNGVKSHKHVNHHESLYIIEGTGEMKMVGKTFSIKSGDYFVIPQNTYHSLKVTSKKPMKVLSVQSPEFLGKDRVFEDVENK